MMKINENKNNASLAVTIAKNPPPRDRLFYLAEDMRILLVALRKYDGPKEVHF